MEYDEAFRQDNFDDIKSKLAALDESIQLPPTLRGDALALRLQGVERHTKPAIHIRWKPLAMVAACFVVVCGVYFGRGSLGAFGTKMLSSDAAPAEQAAEDNTVEEEAEAATAADEGIQLMQAPAGAISANDEAASDAPPMDAPPPNSEGIAPKSGGEPSPMLGSAGQSTAQSFATAQEVQDYFVQNSTNATIEQEGSGTAPRAVVNVSANDETYLYSGMSPDEEGNAKLFISELAGNREIKSEVILGQDLMPRGVHLYRNYVAVISQVQQEEPQKILAQVYNMTSIANPLLVGSVEQSGIYRASMGEKECLYIVTSYNPQPTADLNAEGYLPLFKSITQNAATAIAPTQIYKTDVFYSSYTVISATNFEKNKESDVAAVLSPSTDIYLEGELVLSTKANKGQQPNPTPIYLSQNTVSMS